MSGPSLRNPARAVHFTGTRSPPDVGNPGSSAGCVAVFSVRVISRHAYRHGSSSTRVNKNKRSRLP